MPVRSRPQAPALPVIVALASALTAWAAPAATPEHTRMEPLWIETADANAGEGHTVTALLNLPPGWMFGDAAALVLSDGPWPELVRERVVSALLEERAAVLEFDATASRSTGPEPTAAELTLDVRAAAEALRRDIGVGLVVAIGHGAGGNAALLAASLDRTALRPDGDAGLLAAAVSLGPGPARFALGGAEPGPGWPIRAERLCGVVAAVATALKPDTRAECQRALLKPGAAYAVWLAAP
jgi:hypothetical protein